MERSTNQLNTNISVIQSVIEEIANLKNGSENEVRKILLKYPKITGELLSKSEVLDFYKKDLEQNLVLTPIQEETFLKLIQKKKTRTISGVTPVTVLTKPFPCPGKCIFCPNDVRMPKSYISDEPGAQRAEANKFDPYLQTFNRLLALKNIGHPIDKIELIVLGGTWSFYPREYQIWFVKRCFDALNEFDTHLNIQKHFDTASLPYDPNKLEEIDGSSFIKNYNQIIAKAIQNKHETNDSQKANFDELYKAHKVNESAEYRCIGLVVETRPDEINEEEVIHLRRLGCTKVQIGIQSMNEEVLKLNKRGHDINKTRQALTLLRQAGFKIHAHWMPNLYGSDPGKDISDFKLLFLDENIRPDELKIYPCSLIKTAELMKYYERGLWLPYSYEELLSVLVGCISFTPRYCRLTRIVRDIPSTDIVAGNKKTNFRQIAELELSKLGIRSEDIRSREIKDKIVDYDNFYLNTVCYKTSVSLEYFIEFINSDDLIAGFLRLSLPTSPSYINELKDKAIIREIHVYGQSLEIGKRQKGRAQHSGLGKLFIYEASQIAKSNGYRQLSVISSIGTRKYYEKNGFKLGELYQHKDLVN